MAHDSMQLVEILRSPEFKQCQENGLEWTVLGQGSNVLFTEDFNGFVIINRIPGIRILNETATQMIVEAGAGVIWNDLVRWALANDLGGIENLIRIPGTVGAAPVQNIGAYGMEVQHTIEEVTTLDLKTGTANILSKNECAFGYRNSIFKTALQKKCIITGVRFCLEKNPNPILTYEPVRTELSKKYIAAPTIHDVAAAIEDIRASKLPDPASIGNAGSFFKNPVLEKKEFEKLKKEFPDLKYHETDDGYKVYAGWLLEKTGWRGFRRGAVGVYEKQALILVNHGGATGKEINELARQIECSIESTFRIKLEREVQCMPSVTSLCDSSI